MSLLENLNLPWICFLFLLSFQPPPYPLPPQLSRPDIIKDIKGIPWTGTLPSELGRVTNLRWLEIDGAQFDDGEMNLSTITTIPLEFSSLSKLNTLRITNSNLGGTLHPSLFVNLTNLSELVLSGNNLTGTIPSEIGLLTNLRRLNLKRNLFTGIPLLPTELQQLSLLSQVYI